MIDQVDDQVSQWVKKTLGAGVTLSLDAPGTLPGGEGVSLYLLSLAEHPPLQGAQRAPLQFWVRYLVTTWAQEPSRAHEILGRLLLAAMDAPEYEVELENIPPGIWGGFGIPPRPAFILRAPVRKERAQRQGPPVREPLHVRWVKTLRLNGALYGPEDSPLPGAHVALMPAAGDDPLALEYARLCPSTDTDERGLFTFERVPEQPRYTFYIHLKDQELFAGLDRPAAETNRLVFRWGLLVFQVTGRDGQPAAGSLAQFGLPAGRHTPLAAGRPAGLADPAVSPAPELRLVCPADQEPLRGLRLEYPLLRLAFQANSQGQGVLLLHEKALGQAGQWLAGLRGRLLSADQQPLPGARIACLSPARSATADEQGTFQF